MLNPSQFEDSEEPAQPAQLEHSGDASVWEEGEHIQMEPADAEALLEEAVVEEAVTPQPKKGKGRTTPLAGPKVKDIAAQLQAAADGATEKPKSRKRVTKAAEPAEETSNRESRVLASTDSQPPAHLATPPRQPVPPTLHPHHLAPKVAASAARARRSTTRNLPLERKRQITTQLTNQENAQARRS